MSVLSLVQNSVHWYGLFRGLIIYGALCLSSITATQAQTGISSVPPLPFQGPPYSFDSEDFQPLIVELDLPFNAEGNLPQHARLNQRNEIAKGQEQLRKRLKERGITARHVKQYFTIPYLALTLSKQERLKLEAVPGVRRVVEDRVYFPVLDSSTPVIGVPAAQVHGYDGSGQIVAVLDSGVDYAHSHFTGKLASEACYSTDLPDGTFSNANVHSACPGGVLSSIAVGSGIDCTAQASNWPPANVFCSHGTHVAGIAVGNDPDGTIDGVASGAGLIPMQIFSVIEYTGVGGNPCGLNAACISAFGSDLVLALERVLILKQGGTNIAAANLSLGAGLYTDESLCDSDNASLKTTIDNLRSVGVATVIATANSGSRTAIGSPGCISSAVAVGATDDADNIASFSNVSPLLELLAPGVSITSAWVGTVTDAFASSGTSMATPHVAGAWAVLKQQDPNATVDQILSRLIANGTLVDDNRGGGIETDIPRINLDLSFKMDFGDLPIPYPVLASENGAQHCTSPDLRLGALAANHDFPVLRNATASADDDDGVSNLQLISKGNATITVDFTNNTSNVAQLVCWGDWNLDGDFTDPGERSVPAIFPSFCGAGSADATFTTGNIAAGCSGTTTVLWTDRAATPPLGSNVFTRCRISDTATFFLDNSPEPFGAGGNGEVEDDQFDAPPTAVTIGDVNLIVVEPDYFLTEIGVEVMNRSQLLALLQSWDADGGMLLANATSEELRSALIGYLDPDGDAQVAILRWDTLEERGAIGFYVDRRNVDANPGDSWMRINNDLLPGLITAPMGGEYMLADPSAAPGNTYQYLIIEQEAIGTTRAYGPYTINMP